MSQYDNAFRSYWELSFSLYKDGSELYSETSRTALNDQYIKSFSPLGAGYYYFKIIIDLDTAPGRNENTTYHIEIITSFSIGKTEQPHISLNEFENEDFSFSLEAERSGYVYTIKPKTSLNDNVRVVLIINTSIKDITLIL